MAGQPNLNYNLTTPTGVLSPGTVDGSGLSQMIGSGISTRLNLAAAANIKTGAGRVAKIIVNVVGSAGALTVNDCATTGAATTANQIFTIAFNAAAAAAGGVIVLDVPFTVGLTISAVPTGATLAVVYS